MFQPPYLPPPTKEEAEDAVRVLLRYGSEDPDRGGLKETPARFAKALKFHTSGYALKPEDVLKTFEDGADQYDEMVAVCGIPLWSMCEHHLAPFFGVAHIAYIPDGKVVGLSKLARVLEIFARRLQVQERLTVQVATCIDKALKPKGVGVLLECRHTCMECRGVQKPNVVTKTSALRGALRSDPAARAEFMVLVRNGKS